MRLVLASGNRGKLAELRGLIGDLPLSLQSLSDFTAAAAEETAPSFVENAILKARFAAAASGLPALADDSGLVVPALGGAPGIYSARWAGPDKNFATAMERIERELAARARTHAMADRRAYFVCALALCSPAISYGGTPVARAFEGRVDGRLVWPPRGACGFGYDPMFVANGQTQTFGEMDPAIKHAISHRADAFHKLVAATFTESHSPVGLPSC